MRYACRTLVLPDAVLRDVVIELDNEGRIVEVGAGATAAADRQLGTVVPGIANAHSHAFHRLLRGRTNGRRGNFWQWRDRMYATAATIEPDEVYRVAALVYSELLAAGYTAVGEFHYLHHRPDGTPYPGHEMELAVVAAAGDAGLRITLLDACYLAGGAGVPLTSAQRRFSDGAVEGWLERWHALKATLSRHAPEARLGAAIHSARAVPEDGIVRLVAGLPDGTPLHAHVSEQRAENASVLAATGRTPTAVLADSGALGPATTLVHATHLTEADVALIGGAGAVVALCPTTEADLGDGLGMPRELLDAGARLAIGSDQHVVADPFVELRGVEWMARLRAERRGMLTTEELWRTGLIDGWAALGEPDAARLEHGALLDLVELDTSSARLAGVADEELLFSATAAEVIRTVVRGREHAAEVDRRRITAVFGEQRG